MRFLLSRRWLFFAIAVALAAYLATLLGQWQFHRLEDRKSENHVLAKNLAATPLPIDQVMSTTKATTAEDEWQRVTVHGTYDDASTVILKYQTRDGGAGVDVVTPLVTESGNAVLVDRGWMATANRGNERPQTPAAATGQVTVTGYVRANATGSATAVDDLSTRALSSNALAEHIKHPLYVGFLDLASQVPAAADDLVAVELPDDTSEGPHFFYGLQWWFFGALAVFGFFYLMYDEWRRSKTAQEPAVDRQHDAGDE